jgi:hypothetical protein
MCASTSFIAGAWQEAFYFTSRFDSPWGERWVRDFDLSLSFLPDH